MIHEDDPARFIRAAQKAGLSEEAAAIFATAISKEMDRERKKMDAQIAALKSEMEKMELRMTIKFGALLVVAVGALALIIKL
jgi:hypothetical protein